SSSARHRTREKFTVHACCPKSRTSTMKLGCACLIAGPFHGSCGRLLIRNNPTLQAPSLSSPWAGAARAARAVIRRVVSAAAQKRRRERGLTLGLSEAKPRIPFGWMPYEGPFGVWTEEEWDEAIRRARELGRFSASEMRVPGPRLTALV